MNDTLQYLQVNYFPSDAMVVRNGDIADCIYFITRKFSRVHVQSPQHKIVLAELVQGSFFGDTSCLFQVPSRFDYKITYRTRKAADENLFIYMSYIESRHINKLCNKYVEFGNFLRHRATRRISYWSMIERGCIKAYQQLRK